MSLIYGLYIRSGISRFPPDKFLPDIHPDVEGCYQELNVHPFLSLLKCDTFKYSWESAPITITGNIITHPEHEFRGAKWRLYPSASQITCDVNRGTIFNIGDTASDTCRYMATICCAINKDIAIIQINAFTESQHRLHPYDPEWPTLIMIIPRRYNNVPMPVTQVGYFLHTDYEFLGTRIVYDTGLIS